MRKPASPFIDIEGNEPPRPFERVAVAHVVDSMVPGAETITFATDNNDGSIKIARIATAGMTFGNPRTRCYLGPTGSIGWAAVERSTPLSDLSSLPGYELTMHQLRAWEPGCNLLSS